MNLQMIRNQLTYSLIISVIINYIFYQVANKQSYGSSDKCVVVYDYLS